MATLQDEIPALDFQNQARLEAESSDEFTSLGTFQGLGGSDWQRFEGDHTKDLIRSFTPPLLRPAFVGHAFVLPPKTWLLGVSSRVATIEGEDFFKHGEPNREVFESFEVERQFLDLDLFYGFDGGQEWFHSFTARLNVPVSGAQTHGFIHPHGTPLIDIHNEGENFGLGDIGLFLKKKFVDQAVFPIQVAGAVGVRFPTGSNTEKFTDNSRIKVIRPDVLNDGNPPSPPINTPIPLAFLSSVPRAATPFPFNNGVFGRFHTDGRMPTPLQPGTGEASLFAGLFLTRVNQRYEFPGRSAYHAGATYTVTSQSDGVDPGDKLVLFGSFVKPIRDDYLSFDLSFVTFHQQTDRYSGSIPAPIPTDAAGNTVDGWASATHLTFKIEDRGPFTSGWTGYIAPSLIFSPDPSMRLTVSPLVRVIAPDLGPAPAFVLRAAIEIHW
ncbi:MAG: hypothetical protein P8K08_01620 [Fuerstiella sp.]|nr:hypothetical protein [Fuerstiella sp.]